jgi:hypothetical protein
VFRVFGNWRRKLNLAVVDSVKFEHGLQIMTYNLK